MIHLVDTNDVVTVPNTVIPTMYDPPTTNHLEDHFASLYIDGNTNCDSYDVGLTYLTEGPWGVPAINRPNSHVRNRLRKEKVVGLTRRLEIVEETLHAHHEEALRERQEARRERQEALRERQEALQERQDVLQEREEALQERKIALERAQIIIRVETFDRILQAYNDKIFRQLASHEIDILRSLGVPYITKLLSPPANLTNNELNLVNYALGMLSPKEKNAANALLPILNHLKSGPNGRNAIQHPIPTLEEGICHIHESSLKPNDKLTLILSLMAGLESKRGEKLFLPSSGGETALESLEWEIRQLEARIARWRHSAE